MTKGNEIYIFMHLNSYSDEIYIFMHLVTECLLGSRYGVIVTNVKKKGPYPRGAVGEMDR